MSSIDEANRFVNCVMNRSRHDTVMRGGLVVLLAVLPLIALFYGAIVISLKHSDDDLLSFVSAVCLTFMFYAQMLVIFFIYRRLIDHSTRDIEWRFALMEYARGYGCNDTRLMGINNSALVEERTSAEKPAIILILLLFLFIMICMGFPEVFNVNTDGAINVAFVLLISMLEAFLMFCFVLVYLIKAPHVHESTQIEFTEEFARQMEQVGITVPVMPKAVKNMVIGLSVVLVIITFGLFIFVILYKTFVNTNYHIMNQWEYEVRLMNVIIENEGGIGVMPKKSIEVGQ